MHPYAENAVVTISATPNTDYVFDSWTGDADCTDGSVTMDADKTCTANFVEASPTGEVTLDGAVSSETADGVATISIDHTTGTGTNRLMLVGVSANSYNNARTISSVNFAPDGGSATALSEVGSVENEAGRLTAIYSLLNPPSGVSGTVTVTFSDTVNYGIIAGVANFAGVDQADPLDDFVSAVGTESTAISVDVPTDANDMVFDSIFMGAATIPTLTADASQSELWDATIDRAGGAASMEQASSSTTAMSWTASGGASTYYWSLGAVPINPAAATGPDTTPPVITLLGNANMTVEQGDTFTDPGATASDNVDGNITANIVVGGDSVDTNTLGDYVITYDVQDAASSSSKDKSALALSNLFAMCLILLVSMSCINSELIAADDFVTAKP